MAISTIGTNGLDQTNNLELGATGNVGIGTSSPTFGLGSGLEVSRAGTATVRVRNTTDNVTGETWAYSGGYYMYSITNHPLVFGTNSTEKMRIDSSGNVLIGTTSSTAYGTFTIASSNPVVLNTTSTGINVFEYTRLQQTNAVASSTVDAYRFVNNGGSVIGSNFVSGHFYVTIARPSDGTTYNAIYAVATCGNGTSQSVLTSVTSVTRNTSPVTSIQLANDGVGGNVKLTVTYNAFSGTVYCWVTFIGQVA